MEKKITSNNKLNRIFTSGLNNLISTHKVENLKIFKLFKNLQILKYEISWKIRKMI